MATTFAEYKYGGLGAELKREIALIAANVSPLLGVLKFDELEHNNVSRQRMYTDDGQITEHAVGATWVKNNPHWEFRDSALANLGDDVTVDLFGAQSSDTTFNALMAGNVTQKTRQISQSFDRLAIYGGTTANAKFSASAMVGLIPHIARVESASTVDLDGWLYTGTDANANNTQVLVAAESASATLTLGMIQRLISSVKPFATHLIMSQLMHDKLQALGQAAGTNLIVAGEKLGMPVEMYGRTQVLINDGIKDNFVDPASSVATISTYNYDTGTNDTSPIFAVYMGLDGYCGINGQGMIQVENLAGGGAMENLDARGKRIKAYVGTALRHRKAAAILVGATYS